MGKENRKNYRDDDYLKSIGKRIREIRQSKGLSIVDLAARCNTDASHIGKIERGKIDVSASYLKKIATALEISSRDIIPEDL